MTSLHFRFLTSFPTSLLTRSIRLAYSNSENGKSAVTAFVGAIQRPTSSLLHRESRYRALLKCHREDQVEAGYAAAKANSKAYAQFEKQ